MAVGGWARCSVDRSGDSEDLLTAAEVSRVLGYSSAATVHSYVRRGQFIDPDQAEDLPGGGVRRRWRRWRVWQFADARTCSRTRPDAAGADLGAAAPATEHRNSGHGRH